MRSEKPSFYAIPQIKTVLSTLQPGQALTVQGWVRSRRDSKAGISFVALNDGSCFGNLQVIVPADLSGVDLKAVNTGAAIRVQGELVESPGEGQRVELQAKEVVLVGASEDDYPLQKKRHSLEFLRDIAHLRGRTNAIGAALRVRHSMSKAVHDYFGQHGFAYVHTPIITASDAEGAGELFRVTTLDVNQPPTNERGIDWNQDFFGQSTYLTVSGQLQGEAMALALGRIYTFGPTFRAENSNTARHAAEFWMIEPEMAFCDIHQNAEIAEDFLRSLVRTALNDCREDLEFFDGRIEKGLIDALEEVERNTFEHMTYTQAIQHLQDANQSFEYQPVWGQSLQTEHERYLCEELVKKPLIVTDYPGDNAAFYMRLNDDGKTVRGMDVLVPRIGEIIGGAEREERASVLTERMKAHNINEDDYRWYLDLRRFGGTPHAGFGLGFERLLMFVTGMKNIRDVLPFPRTPRSARF